MMISRYLETLIGFRSASSETHSRVAVFAPVSTD
jgi:hypothetical protein